MASSVLVLVLIAIAAGVLLGGFLMISLTIRHDDHDLGSIRFEAPNYSKRTARSLVGMSTARWE
jgi:hypothetical protein